MRTTHLREKPHVLGEKRQKLIDRFNQAKRDRKNTARVCAALSVPMSSWSALKIATENASGVDAVPVAM